MKFNTHPQPKTKGPAYKSPHVEFYTAYGEPTSVLPDYGMCQFHTPEGFCNSPCKTSYCENHARICGGIYRRK